MEINFTNPEVVFIYGHFKNEIRKLEDLKTTPGNPFSKSDLNKEIKLCSSVVEKLKETMPGLKKLDNN